MNMNRKALENDLKRAKDERNAINGRIGQAETAKEEEPFTIKDYVKLGFYVVFFGGLGVACIRGAGWSVIGFFFILLAIILFLLMIGMNKENARRKEYIAELESNKSRVAYLNNKIATIEQRLKTLPTDVQYATFTQSKAVASLRDGEKRIYILTQQLNDCLKKLQASEADLAQMKAGGARAASYQAQTADWAVAGGIAQGLAGPAAGVAAAVSTMNRNAQHERLAATIRENGNEILDKGVPLFMERVQKLRSEKWHLEQAIDHAKTLEALPNYSLEKLATSIRYQYITAEKTSTDAIKVTCRFRLDESILSDALSGTVLDGTLECDVMSNGVFIGKVYLPLPLYGVVLDASQSTQTTLESYLIPENDTSGNYTVLPCGLQNLWVMYK